jgi:hypothetical protein
MDSIRKNALIKEQRLLDIKLKQKMEEAERYIESNKGYKNFNISTDSKAIQHRLEIQELEKQMNDIVAEITRISNTPKRSRKAVMPNTQQLSAEQKLVRDQQEFRQAQVEVQWQQVGKLEDERLADAQLDEERLEAEQRKAGYANYDFRRILNIAEENKWYTIELKKGHEIRDATGKFHKVVYGTPIGDVDPLHHNDAVPPTRLFDIKCRPIDGRFNIKDIPGITSFYATIENTRNIIGNIIPFHAPNEKPIDHRSLWHFTAFDAWQGPAERTFSDDEPSKKTMRRGEHDFTRQNEGKKVPLSQAATEVPLSQAATAPDGSPQSAKMLDVQFTQELLDSYDTQKIYAITLRRPLIGMDGNEMDDSVVYGYPTSGTFQQYYEEYLFPSREFRIYSMVAIKLVDLSRTLVVNDMTTTNVIETDLPKPSQGGKSIKRTKNKKIKKNKKSRRR